MAKPKKPKYPAELSRPITRPKLGLLASDEELQDAAIKITSERYRKMTMLFDAHRVPVGDWASLCFALAETQFAGFSVAQARSGRRTKWDINVRAELVIAVEETGLNITKATELLATQEPWSGMVGKDNGPQRLRDEYNRADKRWAMVLKDAIAYRALSDEEKSSQHELD